MPDVLSWIHYSNNGFEIIGYTIMQTDLKELNSRL